MVIVRNVQNAAFPDYQPVARRKDALRLPRRDPYANPRVANGTCREQKHISCPHFQSRPLLNTLVFHARTVTTLLGCMVMNSRFRLLQKSCMSMVPASGAGELKHIGLTSRKGSHGRTVTARYDRRRRIDRDKTVADLTPV